MSVYFVIVTGLNREYAPFGYVVGSLLSRSLFGAKRTGSVDAWPVISRDIGLPVSLEIAHGGGRTAVIPDYSPNCG
ncbi:hypothetical protein [Saccharopolyspora phatthalungensis]|uniref:Uncharacterized protein n=1 Tax=Saccharopolyspora phatthalungensis TaxID=664693 RepID=A0A840QD66_9PSEU|nr:hypothetical protein [Saccharopolyspora phatthalungensis]MBB5156578.1 hypothetical protein [Saccharopolyspora phatthalungensis]